MPTWMPVDLRMSQDARCSDAGEEERRWGSSEAGGKKDGGVGGVGGVLIAILPTLYISTTVSHTGCTSSECDLGCTAMS